MKAEGLRWIAQALLVLLGLLHSLAYVLDLSALRGLALATAASPLPLVFSHFRGLETFSSHFSGRLVARSSEGPREYVFPFTPQLYSRLAGPYNRRNVYGAVVAYGLQMTEPNEARLVESVLKYGFCGEAPVARSFQISGHIERLEILVQNDKTPRTGKLRVECPK